MLLTACVTLFPINCPDIYICNSKKYMKHLFVLFFLIAGLNVAAQNNVTKIPALDKSPMDMSYYPVNYPVLKIQNKVTSPLIMRVIYSRPQLNGRKVFGDLQPYGEVWRLGANEATEIEFFKDVKISNKKIKKGRYTLYAIPYPEKWTLILNRETDIWGSFAYDSTKDVLRTDLPVKKNDVTENMSIVFEKTLTGADMSMFWEDVKTTLSIEF
jgi:Protein of unknown function (DUF2911)